MDSETSIEAIIDCVKSILAAQSYRVPLYDRSVTAKGDAEETQLPSILPQSIPPLSASAATLPEQAIPSGDSLAHVANILSEHVLPYLNLSSLSPRYFGFVTGGATPSALVADILTSIYDQNAAVHLPAESIATSIEAAALNLLVELFRLPKDQWAIAHDDSQGGGIITTGATASNILGLALGREYILNQAISRNSKTENAPNQTPLSVGQHGLLKVTRAAGVDDIFVLSTLPHSSLIKAAGVLGIGRDNFISIAIKDDQNNPDLLRINFNLLEQKLKQAQQDRIVYIVSISAGEVNTARFATRGLKEMQQVRHLCDQYGAWLHIDAAFGLFGRALIKGSDSQLVDKSEELVGDEGEYHEIIQGVQGLELADSITGDAHKLLNVPYDCGLFFTRHKALSQAVFSNGNAAYLTSNLRANSDGIQSPMNIGIENSRRFRALPVYATLMTYGRQGYIDMLRRQIGLARRIVGWMYQHKSGNSPYEVLPRSRSQEEAISKTFIGVLFRLRHEDDNKSLVTKINATGQIYVTGTSWEGKPAARIAVSNWQVDIERDLRVVTRVLESVIS